MKIVMMIRALVHAANAILKLDLAMNTPGESINIQNPTILDILSDSSEFQDISLEEYVQITNTMKLLQL